MNIKNKTSFMVRTDLINDYLHDISRYKPFTSAEEESSLFYEYDAYKERIAEDKAKMEEIYNAEGSESKAYIDAKASYLASKSEFEPKMNKIRDEIISRNQRFVLAIAKRYDNDELLADLINEGNYGLLIAFDTYDVKLGNRFCSYAVWYIRRQIKAFLDNTNPTVRITNNVRIAPKVKKFKNDFFLKNGRNPVPAEILQHLDKEGLSITNEEDIYGVKMDYIDAAIGDDEDDVTLENSASFTEKTSISNEYDDEVEQDALSNSMKKALGVLNDREKLIVKMSSGIGYRKEYTNKEIADKIGLTSERVRQIRLSALSKMKAAYNRSIR